MLVPFVGEVIGTMLLIWLGDGVVANVLLNQSKGEGGGWIVITAGWGFAVFIAVFATASLSGAHINPAVTLGLAVAGLFEWGMVPIYFAAQMLGAFIGAILVYLQYLPHWEVTEDPGLKLAAFSTAPAIYNTPANLISEALGTFVLVFGVLTIAGATVDLSALAGPLGVEGQMMSEAPVGLGALGAIPVGLLVFGIGLSLGGPTGYAINPARDLGPRIAHAILPIPGKGDSDWGYSWIPIVGDFAGGALAALVWLILPGFGA